MKNPTLALLLFFACLQTILSQSINVSDALGCYNSLVMTLAGTHNGKNYYNNTTNGICVFWNSTDARWELDGVSSTPGESVFVTHRSTVNTATNPPDLALGGWMEITGSCGNLTQFDGSGTESGMPVELIDFETALGRTDVNLHWRTASETNNTGFEVQRSGNGRDFHTLAFVEGYGTTQEEQRYSYTDGQPLSGTNYYRLRQVDLNGQFEYSRIISVKIGSVQSALAIWPNPLHHSNTLNVQLPEATEGLLRMVSTSGQEVYRLNIEGDENAFKINLSDLPKGLYYVEMQSGNNYSTERLFIK